MSHVQNYVTTCVCGHVVQELTLLCIWYICVTAAQHYTVHTVEGAIRSIQ